jgi:tryptophan synthase alpha chain
MADGPVIQRSSERALKGGTDLKAVLKLVKDLRKSTEIPIILMGYFNPLLQWGCEAFCKEAAGAGVDGLIVVDLPPEESAELHRPAKKAGLSLIYLLTPTSDEERVKKVRKLASGFAYYVSVTGITGASLSGIEAVEKQIRFIQNKIPLPICVGFGIRKPEQAREVAKVADGVVVGTRLVALLEKGRSRGVKEVVKQVRQLKKAIL